MRAFSGELAEIRFGYGLSPKVEAPSSVEEILSGLTGPDPMFERFPVESFEVFLERMQAIEAQFKIRRKNRGTDMAKAAMKERNRLNRSARVEEHRWMASTFLRKVHSRTAFRERLVAFWGDHFTAQGKRGVARRAGAPYLDDAIRPHITGRFADLLIAAVTHPIMLHYLDQDYAMGPNSLRAKKRGKKTGLNENLAREVLELHTLGVGGPYGQEDVRQLAELFTGLSLQVQVGFKFRKDFAEPGAETVLGRSYGPDPGTGPIFQALEDLALHPATAAHIARKLAVHFVSDTPDPALVDQVTRAYVTSGGDLMETYAALLDHPGAWGSQLENIKPPIDFIASTMRALYVRPDAFRGLNENQMRDRMITPLFMMGQPWLSAPGPDGWPEEDTAWISPQNLAWRVQWAMAVPERMVRLPDPRSFVDTALGSYATGPVRFAAKAAESQREAVGIVILSPAFQRR